MLKVGALGAVGDGAGLEAGSAEGNSSSYCRIDMQKRAAAEVCKRTEYTDDSRDHIVLHAGLFVCVRACQFG